MIGKAVFHERLWKLRLRKLNCTMDVSKRFLRYSLFLLSWASWFRLVEERNLPQNFCCYVLGVAMDIPIPKIRSLESSFTFPPASVKKKTEIRRPEKKKKSWCFVIFRHLKQPRVKHQREIFHALIFVRLQWVDGIREIFCRPLRCRFNEFKL